MLRSVNLSLQGWVAKLQFQYNQMKRDYEHKRMITELESKYSLTKNLFASTGALTNRTISHPDNQNQQFSKIKGESSFGLQHSKSRLNIACLKSNIFRSEQADPVQSLLVKLPSSRPPFVPPGPSYPFKKHKIMLIQDLCRSQKQLRETKSTQCQSPVAKKPIFYQRLREYRTICPLGQGRFGKVYLARHAKTGFLGALKVIKKSEVLSQQSEKQKVLSQLISEIKIQSFLDHPNLIKLYDFFCDEQNVYLFLELAADGQLFHLMDRHGKFTEESVSLIIRELAEGIKYMHSKSIIHRDIKLENIVFTHGMAKICDFGWSVYEPKEFRKTLCGTPLYLSPEILQGKRYNEKIDIWALGTLAHELFTNKNPFGIVNREDLSKIITQKFQMKTGSPQIRSFVNFILNKNPGKRPDADILLGHPFIRKFADLQTSQEICIRTYAHLS